MLNRLTPKRTQKVVYIFHHLRSVRNLSVSKENKLRRVKVEAENATSWFVDDVEEGSETQLGRGGGLIESM